MKATNHGGKRKGAGRKPKYGEPTTTIRIPVSLKQRVITFVEQQKQNRHEARNH